MSSMANLLNHSEMLVHATAQSRITGIPRSSSHNGFRAPHYQGPQEDFWSTFLHIVRRRKWTVVAFLSLVVLLVLSASLLMKPRYQAAARIVFNRENADPLGFKDMGTTPPEDSDYSVSLDTQVRILESDTLALQAIRELHLDSNPSFYAEKPKFGWFATNHSESPSETAMGRQDALLQTFHNGLSASKDKNTRVIEIRFQSVDARLAADVANAVARAYIEHNFKTKYESIMLTSDWLSQQLSELQTKVEVSQQKLVEYQKENGILGIDEKQNIVTARLNDLNRELTNAQADRIQKESSYQLARTQNAELVVKAEPDAQIQKLRAQQAALNSQYAQAIVQLGPSNPRVLELEGQMKELQVEAGSEIQKISSRIKNQYSEAVVRENIIRAALEQQKQEANILNERAIEFNLLKRDVESNRQLYEGLQQKLKEASVSAGLRSSNIQIVDVAQVPSTPSEPRILRNLAAAFVLGLAGGIALALVQERFDRTLRSVHQVELLSPFYSLGIIPMGSPKVSNSGRETVLALDHKSILKETGSMETIVSSDPMSALAESYRAVANSVLLSSTIPPKTILVTSAVTQEGKTTTSINLAVVLARKGKRILLVDADLRKQGIQKALHLPLTNGLSSMTNAFGNVAQLGAPEFTPGAAMVTVPGVPNLFVIPAGPPNLEQSELVSSEFMRNLILDRGLDFDHIIVDAPPVLLMSDAVRLSVEADSVVLVVRSGYTSREAFSRAQELLQQVNAPVTGVVFNAADLESPEFSYYREYGYYGPSAS
jgi:polysaccharide biosynthesis transport protein